jgi:hypothetical protein
LEITQHGCTIERNQGETQDGGLLNWSGEAVLNDSAVGRNTAPDGGGVFVRTGTVTLNRSAVNEKDVNNRAAAGAVPGGVGRTKQTTQNA